MTPAPVDATALDATLRPFGKSRTLPAQAYVDPAVLAWERRHLFAGAWTCLGRIDELAASLTQRALNVGDVGVLLTFSDGLIRAFANVCRHRGHELLPDGGSADRAATVCPYHGWAYNLDGTLAAAPGMRDAPEFDRAAHALVSVPVTVWHDWVFVNATGSAPAFDSYLGGLAALISPYAPERLSLGARHMYEVAANWKLLVENYHECYHCTLIHPELCAVSPPTSGANWDLPGAWVGGAMELREHAQTMSFTGRSDGVPIEGVDPRTVGYVGLFPNLLISAHPDYVMTHRLVPLAPDRTHVECSWYFPPGVDEHAYAVEFWDRTNRQDWAACESVQRGVASPHFRPGPFAPREDAVYRWVTLIARAYRNPAEALHEACAAS
jgi:glycine betaine catabolism A